MTTTTTKTSKRAVLIPVLLFVPLMLGLVSVADIESLIAL